MIYAHRVRRRAELMHSFLPVFCCIFCRKAIWKAHPLFLQIFAGSSNSLYINMTYKNGTFTFTNVAAVNEVLKDKTSGKDISVNAKEWFSIDIKVYVSGKTIDGATRYGIFTVTQNGITQTAYLNSLHAYRSIESLNMYSLNGAVNKVYYDNVSVYSTVIPGVHDGEYHFDTITQQISDKILSSPTNKNDKVYPIFGGETGSFTPDAYSTNYVIYNFDYFQGAVLLSEAEAGDIVYYTFKDSTSKKITGIYLGVNEDGTVSVYAANGQLLSMSYPGGFGDSTVDSLKVDKSKWITVKLEYHYDLGEPQLDVVIKYADLNNNGYNRTVAATLTDVGVHDVGAGAQFFTSFEIHYSGNFANKIYVDDLYIRNVYVQ